MQLLALALLVVCFPSAVPQRKKFWESIKCSQGLSCQLMDDVLCMRGEQLPDPELEPVLVLTEMNLRNKLRCQQQNCIPCVEVALNLGLLGAPALSTEDGGTAQVRRSSEEHDTSTQEFLETYILLSARRYTTSRCVTVKVLLSRSQDWQNSTLGSLQFDCFPVALSGELHVTAFTRPHYRSTQMLNHTHRGPDCTWHKAKEAINLCQVPRLEVSVGLEKVVLHVWDIPAGQNFSLWLYLNRTKEFKDQGKPTLLTGPKNVSLPISNVFPCLCLQVWPKIDGQEDSPRTHLCPFTNDAEAVARAWAHSHLELHVSAGTLSCFLSAPCNLPGELVPCWKGGQFACSLLHPQLHMAVTPGSPQEFPGLSPHPNLCVQVRSNGSTYLQSCLLENITGCHQQCGQDLLLLETVDSHGSPFIQVLEQSKWVPIAQAVTTRNGILAEALQNDLQSGQCKQVWRAKDDEAGVLWACSREKFKDPDLQDPDLRDGVLLQIQILKMPEDPIVDTFNQVHTKSIFKDYRTHWALVWMIVLLGIFSILLVLALKKKALKGWIRILKEDYCSGGVLQGRHILILYSPDHAAFERLVGTLAGSLAQLQLIVSLELWSRGELGSLGPMQWFHAQRHRVLQEGGTILLLFSHGAIASCAEWLGGEPKDTPPCAKSDSTFLTSLNCVLPDFLAGKAKGKYMVACFEELLPVHQIPEFFRSASVYPLPSQLFNFLVALAGPKVNQDQRSSLRRHVMWISKRLEWAVQDYRRKMPSGKYPALMPLQHGCTHEEDQASF